MYKSSYLNKVLDEVKLKNQDQPEFINAVIEFLDSMEEVVERDSKIEENAILERLVVPERAISFRVPWIDDNGKIRVNMGYRVQFNSAIGPYKGGLRFDKSVNLSILKFLAFEQIFKNSLTGLPIGGGKGGSDVDPIGKSDGEVMRFCQAFMAELYKYIGPEIDVPAGDIGVGAREIGYLFGYYKKLTNDFSGVLTGKGIEYGGSNARPEATGYGVMYFASEMLKVLKNETLKGKRVIISGSGKVASFALQKAVELGAKVVAMSDRNGWYYDPKGIDSDFAFNEAKKGGETYRAYIKKYPNCLNGENNHDIWNLPCDIAFPCATQKEINIDDAKNLKKNGCFMVCEGANMPTDIEAIRYFNQNDVLFAPGKAANAGGVAVSCLEMSQNAMHLSWTFEEVDEKLKSIMKNIFNKCHEAALAYNDEANLAKGANIAGFMKVYKAMLQEGLV